AVGRVTDSFIPLIWRQPEISALLLVRIVSHLRHDLPRAVQNCHPPLQLGKNGIIAPDMHRRWHAQVLLNDLHKVPLEVPVFDAIAIAIADQQQWRLLACVQGDAMTSIEFALGRSGPAESLHELALLIELE